MNLNEWKEFSEIVKNVMEILGLLLVTIYFFIGRWQVHSVRVASQSSLHATPHLTATRDW